MSTNVPHTPGEFGEPPVRPAPARGPGYYARKGLKALASLQLTVVLFALGTLLIFFGTLAQLDNGIWTVVDKYFWSWVVEIPFDLMAKFLNVFWKERFPDGTHWGGTFPFPAGKLLGALMLVNLLAAHATRFRLTWKRAGVFLIHGGLILLFVGEFVTREYAIEQRMTIDEGASVNYTEDSRHVELTFVDKSDPAHDTVSVIPQNLLQKPNGRIKHPDLPVDVEVVEFMANSSLEKAKPGGVNRSDRGHGVFAVAVKRPEVSGVDPNQKVDMPAVYVKFYKKGSDEALGTYMTALMGYFRFGPDEVDLDGKKLELMLRFKRYYKPYSIKLDKFRFDKYTGTQKAKNYSSDVRVFDEGGNLVREQRISMNDPLRYNGETFYQSSFDEKTEQTTILQVVKNPGWLLPYVSCVVVGLGLCLHFGIYLVQFLRRGATVRAAETAAGAPAISAPASRLVRYFPWIVLGVMSVYLLSIFGRMTPPKEPVDLDAFGRMPIVEGGRVKPLDTLARVHLRTISGREEIEHKGKKIPAIQWYLDVLDGGGTQQRGPVWDYEFVRIDNEQVLAELDLKPREGLRYSLNEIGPKFDRIQQRAVTAERKPSEGKKPDITDTKFMELHDRLGVFMDLAAAGGRRNRQDQGPLLLPPHGEKDWSSLKEVRAEATKASMTDGMTTVRAKIAPKLEKFSPEDEAKVLKALGMKPEELKPEERTKVRTRLLELLSADLKMITPEMRGVWLDTAFALLSEDEERAIRTSMRNDLQRRMAEYPAAETWEKILTAYRDKKPAEFSAAVNEYRTTHAAGVRDTSPTDSLIEKILYAPFNVFGHNKVEITFNRFAPFYQCSGLYVIVFVLSVLGFTQQAAGRPQWATALRHSALALLVLTLIVHTVALFARMYIMERPMVFVTNLYSSAIFIGWGCVGLGLILELIFRMGVGNVLAAILGLATCIVGHNLATDDTLEMMQAVLDTNFWLATHVTTITLGYTATFVAGVLGALYVMQMLAAVVRDSYLSKGEPTVGELLAFGVASTGSVAIPVFLLWFFTTSLEKFELLPSFMLWTLFGVVLVAGVLYAIGLMLLRVSTEGVDAQGKPLAGRLPGLAQPLAAMALTPERGKTFGQMVYGVVCFALLLSFVGTVLGGIWADQSWGRFWGWDPKENGAVLIVVWNALILHARWAGLVKDRGVAVLAIFGTTITAWSWFGTNQLGLGLHAYGFDSRLADGCFNFWVCQLMILTLGLIPSRFWSSATRRAALASATATAPASTAPTDAAAPAAPVASQNGSANGVPHAAPPNGHPNGKPTDPPHGRPRRDKGKRHGKRR